MVRSFSSPYGIGLIKTQGTGSLYWGFAFVGVSMAVSAMFVVGRVEQVNRAVNGEVYDGTALC
jgi:hypothetical protein